MNPLPSPWRMLQGGGWHELAHSPNLGIGMPRPFVTSAMAAEWVQRNKRPITCLSPMTPENLRADQLAREIVDRRRVEWDAQHPGGDYSSDRAEYESLGKELVQAGCWPHVTIQWLAMCCAHYREQQSGGRWRFLDTHQTEMQPAAPGMDPRLVCVRCGATFPKLNREPCRGDEIYRERVRTDRVKLGELVNLFSELGG